MTFLPIVQDEKGIAGYVVVPVLFLFDDQWATHRAKCGVNVADRIARLEAVPKRAAALARARKRLSALVEGVEGNKPTLSTLRLRAGLSQSQLAEAMGTQQSNISRWERDPSDLRATTIRKLAAALNVSAIDILSTLDTDSEVIASEN